MKKYPHDWDERTQEYRDAILKAEELVQADLELYRAKPPATFKAKAEVEAMIWDKIPAPLQTVIQSNKVRRGGDGYNARWFAYLLSDDLKPDPFKVRARLYKAAQSHDVEFAWDYLDGGGTPGRVCDGLTLAKEAYKAAPPGKAEDAFREAFEEHLTSTKARPRNAARKSRGTRNKAPRIRPPQGPRTIQTAGALQESKEVWNSLQESALEPLTSLVNSRLEGIVDPAIIAEIVQDFRLGVQSCYQLTLDKIRTIRAKGSSLEILAVKQTQIIEASEILGLEVPSRGSKEYKGWRPDKALVKKTYWKLSARYHPDKPENADDDNILNRYKAIQQAYTLLK